MALAAKYQQKRHRFLHYRLACTVAHAPSDTNKLLTAYGETLTAHSYALHFWVSQLDLWGTLWQWDICSHYSKSFTLFGSRRLVTAHAMGPCIIHDARCFASDPGGSAILADLRLRLRRHEKLRRWFSRKKPWNGFPGSKQLYDSLYVYIDWTVKRPVINRPQRTPNWLSANSCGEITQIHQCQNSLNK